MIKPKMSARVWMGLVGALVALLAAVVIPAMLVNGPNVDGAADSGVVSGESGASGAATDREVTGTETKQKIDDVVLWLFAIAGVSGVLTVLFAWHTSPRRRVRLAGLVDDPGIDAVTPEDRPASVVADFVGTTVGVQAGDDLPIPHRPERVQPLPPIPVAATNGHSAGHASMDAWSSEMDDLDEAGRKAATERLASKLFPRRDGVPSAPNPRPARPDDARSPGSA